MSDPTKVASSTNASDSGSSSRPASSRNCPAGTQLKRCWAISRWPAGMASRAKNRIAATTNAAHEVTVPTRWPTRSVRRPPSSSTAAPSSGRATSSQVRENTPEAAAVSSAPWAPTTDGVVICVSIPFASELEQVGVVDRGGAARAEDAEDDRQADDDLGRGDEHHEQRDHLAVQGPVHAGERDEREVGRVEHQLDAHEHDDRVAAQQEGRGADREQDRRQVQVRVQAHRRPPCSTSSSIRATAASYSPAGRTCSRARSTRDTDSSLGVPSGSSAGVSTALCRAKTPGAGRPVCSRPSRNRRSARSRWVTLAWIRSRWASTIAPIAAVISSALVTSNAHTYWVKILPAMPTTLPSAFASVSPTGLAKVTEPTAVMIRTPSPRASSRPTQRWPAIVSTSESAESTPTSMSTKRNSIMTAPV